MTSNLTFRERALGSLYGMAYGDSWGYKNEFLKHEQIIQTQPEAPAQLVITDDTQMSIYNMFAIHDMRSKQVVLDDLPENIKLQNLVRKTFTDQHVKFYYDPDNNRAPGVTCMTALKLYEASQVKATGAEGVHNDSKGCGTVMRAPWLGLLAYPRRVIMTLAALQSQTTHGHPAATISSVLAATLVHDIIKNPSQFTLTTPEQVSQPVFFNHAVTILDELTRHTSTLFRKQDIQAEVKVMRETLGKHIAGWDGFLRSGMGTDINEFYGEGWVADEALYNALAVANRYQETPSEGLRRLVYTNGDSDSIAAVGGAFLGVLTGYEAFQADIMGRLEPRYQVELKECERIINTR